MSDPISQPDIADRQLLAINAPRVGTWTEIGQAEVTYTIFGKAKVRIIRKNDKARRTRMLLVTLAGTILAVAAWRWVATQQTEPVQESPELPQAATAPVQVVPATQSENLAPVQSAVQTQPITVPAAVISKPAINQKTVAPQQQPAGPVADEQAVAKPAPARRPKAAAVQGEAVAAESGTPKAPAEKTSLPKATPPSQPTVPAVATPTPTKTVERPAASNAAAPSPTVPSTKEAAPAVLPAGEKQPATPVNMQSK